MSLADQIAAAEAQARGTADRFAAAANDPELRQALAAQLREDNAVVNALKDAR